MFIHSRIIQMNKTIDFQVLFYFSNENTSIIEIKRLDLPQETDRNQRYYWLTYHEASGAMERLHFVSMQVSSDSEERVFEEGLLHFNQEQALYTDLDSFDTETLQVKKPDLLPEALRSVISLYFQRLS